MEWLSTTNMNSTPITECLACGGRDLRLTLDLGSQPPANNLRVSVADEEESFPLAINRCSHCNHLQLTHAVNPKLIYEHYLYVSGTSKTYAEYMAWYARFVEEYFDIMPQTVLDIGCNDGSQLTAFKNIGFDTYGVDPAKNLIELSARNHTVVCDFWNPRSAAEIYTLAEQQKFDVITTQNAFAHIPDPLTYLRTASEYLTDNGLIFISTSQADMVLNNEFDTIYHEHISYYNAYSMSLLAGRAGLFLQDVVKTPIHGTSYIFVLGKNPRHGARVENVLDWEIRAGLQNPQTYENWAKAATGLLGQIKSTVEHFKHHGYVTVGYGAAAKGMTLITATGMDLDFIIDDNPMKQGMWCPGVNISIQGPDALDRLTADERVLFVPLAWNFYTEIQQRIKQHRASDLDVFMRYFPEVDVR
jgi:2-polyprenyl-3-methyl-5-hydroxy-6-metoxy-1,4-benzoquinol methylase